MHVGFCLDTFRDDFYSQRLAEAEDGLHHVAIIDRSGNTIDKRPINLDPVDMELAKRRHRRIANAEIVYRNPHALIGQSGKFALYRADILGRVLGDLDFQHRGGKIEVDAIW